MTINANAPIGIRGAAENLDIAELDSQKYTNSRSNNQAKRKSDSRNRFARQIRWLEFNEARHRHKWGGR